MKEGMKNEDKSISYFASNTMWWDAPATWHLRFSFAFPPKLSGAMQDKCSHLDAYVKVHIYGNEICVDVCIWGRDKRLHRQNICICLMSYSVKNIFWDFIRIYHLSIHYKSQWRKEYHLSKEWESEPTIKSMKNKTNILSNGQFWVFVYEIYLDDWLPVNIRITSRIIF